MHQPAAEVRFLPRISPVASRCAIISDVMEKAPLAWAAALATLLPAAAGCVDQSRPAYEAPSRKQAPTPVCAEGIAPPRRNKGDTSSVVRDLEAEQWLEIMVPDYDASKGMDPKAADCTGQYVFANETLRYGISRDGWPRLIDPDDFDVRSGPRGLRALRLRALAFENGDVGGPIALVRAVDDRAEVIGIGSYRGPADAELSPMRLGNEPVLVAESKRCPDPYNCRKVAEFYLVRRGRLINAATVDLDRVMRVPSVSEKGLYAEYRLVTDVNYSPQGVELHEQMTVKIIPYEKEGDRDSDRLLRTVEFTRLLKLDRDTLFSSNESLWERVVGQD
jgi:hypothetical protein